jgi:hypothetical protein
MGGNSLRPEYASSKLREVCDRTRCHNDTIFGKPIVKIIGAKCTNRRERLPALSQTTNG